MAKIIEFPNKGIYKRSNYAAISEDKRKGPVDYPANLWIRTREIFSYVSDFTRIVNSSKTEEELLEKTNELVDSLIMKKVMMVYNDTFYAPDKIS